MRVRSVQYLDPAIANVSSELHGRCRLRRVGSVLSLDPVMANVSDLYGRVGTCGFAQSVNIRTIFRFCGGGQPRRREATPHAGSLSTIPGSRCDERLVGATRHGVDACVFAQPSISVLSLGPAGANCLAGGTRPRMRVCGVPSLNAAVTNISSEQHGMDSMNAGSLSTILGTCYGECLVGAAW